MKTIPILISSFLLSNFAFPQINESLEITGNRFKYEEQVLINAFTPIVNVNNEFLDTLNVFWFSKAMYQLYAENLYLYPPSHDVIRLSRFTRNGALVFEIAPSQTDMRIRMISCSSDHFNLYTLTIRNTKVNFPIEEYSKLRDRLKSHGFWDLDDSSIVVPREYIFESFIDGEYYFRYKGELDLRTDRQYKGLIKIFKELETKMTRSTATTRPYRQ